MREQKTNNYFSFRLAKDIKIFIPAIFLFSGYVYESSLLYFFSINISNYFLISDYLSACFNQIMIIIIFLLVGYVIPLNQILMHNQNYQKSNSVVKVFLSIFTISSLFIIFYFFHLHSLPWDPFVLATGILYVGIFLKKTPEKIFIISFFCTIYIFLLSGIAYYAYHIIITEKPNALINFTRSSGLQNGKYSIITSNSQYCFLYDKKTKKVIIVPIRKINSTSKILEKLK